MDTATLPTFTPSTIADGDTALLPTVGRHRRPSLLARVRYYTAPEPVPTAVILLGVLLMVAGVVAAAVWPAPVSPGAVWNPTPVAVAPAVSVQCDSDASCAAYDWARGVQPAPVLAPAPDGGTAYRCPAGWDLLTDEDAQTTQCLPAGYVDGQRWT